MRGTDIDRTADIGSRGLGSALAARALRLVLDVQRDYVGDVARGKAFVHPRDLYLGSHYGVLHEIAANLPRESETHTGFDS